MKIKELASILEQPFPLFQTFSIWDDSQKKIVAREYQHGILKKYGDVDVYRMSTGDVDDGIVFSAAGPVEETPGDKDKKEAYTKRDVGRVLHRWRNFKGEGYEDTEIDREDDRNTPEHTFEQIAQKTVHDGDGFTTDYTWYRRDDGLNVFVFGDSEIYRPEDEYYDWEEENDEAAQEWFDNYDGIDEEEERDYDDDFSDYDE